MLPSTLMRDHAYRHAPPKCDLSLDGASFWGLQLMKKQREEWSLHIRLTFCVTPCLHSFFWLALSI